MKKETILIVDDENEISELIDLYLSREGYQTVTIGEGFKAIETVSRVNPDLILLDIQLPDLDGFEVCLEIRKVSKAPIIFVSCKAEDVDKILGLGVGGDDYITKPFSPGELVARVKAHLRRKRMMKESGRAEETIVFQDLEIDLRSHSVRVEGKSVSLSAKEYQLLILLARNPNRVFSMEQLFHQIWESPSLGDPRTIMVHISNLRKKIEKNPAEPVYILTVRGGGYKFRGDDFPS